MISVWDLEESELVVKRFQGQEAYEKLKQEEKELGIEGRASPEPNNDDDESDGDEPKNQNIDIDEGTPILNIIISNLLLLDEDEDIE